MPTQGRTAHSGCWLVMVDVTGRSIQLRPRVEALCRAVGQTRDSGIVMAGSAQRPGWDIWAATTDEAAARGLTYLLGLALDLRMIALVHARPDDR